MSNISYYYYKKRIR